MFSFVKYMQILTWPLDFGTTTMPAHQSVGSSIREMTPNFPILVNSALAFFISDNGTGRTMQTVLHPDITRWYTSNLFSLAPYKFWDISRDGSFRFFELQDLHQQTIHLHYYLYLMPEWLAYLILVLLIPLQHKYWFCLFIYLCVLTFPL
jgi:hypothetical protein